MIYRRVRSKRTFKTIRDQFYFVCQSGGRCRKACEKLESSGLQIVNVDGGTSACIAAGLPVIRGKGSISLERQVRIAAGSLVVIGVTLGHFVYRASMACLLSSVQVWSLPVSRILAVWQWYWPRCPGTALLELQPLVQYPKTL